VDTKMKLFKDTRYIFLFLLICLFLFPSLVISQPFLQLKIEEDHSGYRLRWNAPAGQNRWAVIRSTDPYFQNADTLAFTSDTTWFDQNVPDIDIHEHIFYRVFPWTPITITGEPSTIIDFNHDELTTIPYQYRDLNPSIELLSDTLEAGNILAISGDTWKYIPINPIALDTSRIWSIDAYTREVAGMQMVGIGDGTNEMWYVLWGQQAPNTDSLITTYQGYFAREKWHTIGLPVYEDFYGRFGYTPEIDRVFIVNEMFSDNDEGTWYIDDVRDITDSQPNLPEIGFNWTIDQESIPDTMVVSFTNMTYDEDSDNLTFFWSFGDGGYSYQEHPVHHFVSGGQWPVSLVVSDNMNSWSHYTATIIDDPVTQPEGHFNIVSVGDIILARNVATRYLQPEIQDIVDDTLKHIISSADIAIGNLESPLTNYSVHHPTKTIYFKGIPDYGPAISETGFDFVTLANNHILDYMEPGMLETQATMEANGVLWGGADVNDILARRPTFLNKNGKTMAVLCYSNRDGHYNNYQPFLEAGRDRAGFAMWNRSAIEATIPTLLDETDLIMVQVHCGSEYSVIPMDGDSNSEETRFDIGPSDPNIVFSVIPDSGEVAVRHYAVDMGADMVICHHPHIIQGLEVYNGKLIAHSLGNFVFDLTYNETLHSMLLEIYVGDDGVDYVRVYPVWIEDYLPVLARGELARNILDYLTHYSRLLSTDLIRFEGNSHSTLQWDQNYSRTSTSGEITVEIEEVDSGYLTRPIKIPVDNYVTEIGIGPAYMGAQIRYGRDLLLWGNMEDEGADPWDLNSDYEGYTTNESYRGERSIEITIPANVESNYLTLFEQRVKINTLLQHSVLGWLKTRDAVSAEYQIHFYRNRSGGVVEEYLTPSLSGTTDWTPVYIDIGGIPSANRFVNIRCNQGQPEDDDVSAWYDDVSLIEWQDWTTVGPLGSIELPYPDDYRYCQIFIPDTSPAPEDSVTIDYTSQWPAFEVR